MKIQTAITSQQDPQGIARMNDIMQPAGQAANEQAAGDDFQLH